MIAAWTALDSRRRLAVGLAAGAALICMIAIWQLAGRTDYALLYAGLKPATAGEVVAALEGRGVPFDVRGGAIYIPSDMRDTTRLSLAADGLPATGGVGYELLDTMSGFGTTAQMFDAAYLRAKEGELARTILASRGVRAARVHIATPPRQPFSSEIPATASVSVTPARDAIDAAQADAIRYLVASAVSGLDSADVTVIDSVNGVILGGESARDTALDPTRTDSRAAQMEADLERLLAARVGPGKARVKVNIDADMDSQRITERVIDPASRVAVSTDLDESTETSSGGAGAVTVASNLPAGDAENAEQGSTSTRSETRERQNFEISETRRERVIQPGQIRRVTAAVIVDGITEIAADGTRSWSPRSEEEMTALRELVETAIGFDPARGDRVTLQTLEFPAPPAAGTTAVTGGWQLPGGSVLSLIQTAVLAVVVLLLGLFVIRPLLTRQARLPAPEILAGSFDTMVGDATGLKAADTPEIADPDQHKIRNLRHLVTERRDESADVLRRWIETSEQAEETA